MSKMNSKLFVLFLSAFLLVQCSWGKAVDTSKDSSDDSSDESLEKALIAILKAKSSGEENSKEEADERIALLVYTLVEFIDLVETNLNGYKKMLEQAGTEVADDAAAKAKIDEMNAIIEKIDKADKKDGDVLTNWMTLVIELCDLIDKTETKNIEKPTDSDILLEKALHKNGWDEVEKEAEKKFNELCGQIVEKAEKYWNSLSSKEQMEDKKMGDWLKTFKEETDVEKKFDMLTDVLAKALDEKTAS